MFSYFKLFRWRNLLVIALTQYLFRYCIIAPILNKYDIELYLSGFHFFLLVLATLLVSAAGYAINDYFDLRIDRINKPHKIILGRKLSRRKAIFSHTSLNIIAFLIGLYLAFHVRYLQLAGVFVVIPGLLWMYSLRYKRRYLIGNIVVSLLSTFVIVIVWAFEYRGIIFSETGLENNLTLINQYLWVYAGFAFFVSLIREITKDIEDIKGDMKTGCKTIPIVSGIRNSKKAIILLTIFLILFIGFFQIYLLNIEYDLIFAYLLFAVQIPLILFINRINIAKEKVDFTINVRFIKFIMVTGIFSMFLFYFYL